MAEIRNKLIAGMKKAKDPAANEDRIENPENHTLVVTSHDMGTANFAYFIGLPQKDETPKQEPKRFACILGFIRWILTSLDGQTVPDYDQSIVGVLLKEPLIAFHRMCRVYIEQQVAPENPVMYAIASGVTMFYLVRKNDLTTPNPEAIFTVNAHLKFSYFGVKCPEGKAKKPYRKKLCRQIVLYLLRQWVANGLVHKKWLDFYIWNNKKQDDLADSFLQCYVEECKRHNIYPTWAALEALWGYLVTDDVFKKNGSCPLELTAEMDKKYASYLNRLDKEKEKAAKEQQQQQQQQQAKKKSKDSGHDQRCVAPPAAASSASSSARRVIEIPDESDDIQFTPPSGSGDKSKKAKTQLGKALPVSAKARRQGLEFEPSPEKKNGSKKEQRELLETLQKAKKDGREDREQQKRKRRREEEEEEDEIRIEDSDENDPSYKEPLKVDSGDEEEDLRRAIRESLAEKDHLDQEDMLLLDAEHTGPADLLLHKDGEYNDDDDFEAQHTSKKKKQKSKYAKPPREEHFLVQKERLALEKIERELASKSPGVMDITEEAEKILEAPPLTKEDEEFERMLQAQQSSVTSGK